MTKTEAQTRRQIIDKRLKSAGSEVKNPIQVTEELDIWIGLPRWSSRTADALSRPSVF